MAFVDDLGPHDERRMSLGPERDMIIRGRYSSTPSLPPVQNEPSEVRENREPLQHLLPPPSSGPSLTRIFPFLSSTLPELQIPLPTIQLGFFLLKVVSAFQPCSPLAVNPWMFYPLLLLAALNLRTRSIGMQIMFLIIHLVAVSLSMQFGVMCLWQTPRLMMFSK